MITSKTSFLALIGNPVEHSLSPIMQNAALEYLNIDLVYLALPCKNEDFEYVIKTLKKVNCEGLNITIPYKERVFNLCSEISPIAKKIKAINTLKINSNNEWIGTNTDVDGFKYPLTKYDLINKKAIVLGCGGAGRSAVQGLIELKLSEIVVISRNKFSMDNLLSDFKNEPNLSGLISTDTSISELIKSSDLIVNATPVGMNNVSNNENIPFGLNLWNTLNSNTIVYDLIYNPRPTPFLKLCSKKGCQTIDGLEMLIAQGAKSLSFWTSNNNIPTDIMRDALKENLHYL